MTVLTGGNRFNHLPYWKYGEKAIKSCFGIDWLPRHSSVLTRFIGKFKQKENEILRTNCVRLANEFIVSEKIKEDVLIFDSSVLTRYGEQEGARRGYNPKKHGRASQNPIIASIGTGYNVNIWNRSGDTHTAHQSIEFYEQTRRGLPVNLRISWVLADSGFPGNKFLTHLEARGDNYIMALRLTKWVQQKVWSTTQWRSIGYGIDISEGMIELEGWESKRRIIIVRQRVSIRPKSSGKQLRLFKDEEDTKEYRYSVLVTNDDKHRPEELWEIYRGRSLGENCIKELKEGYGWDAFNVKSFWGTEAAMILIGMVFYNLIHFLNRKVFSKKGEVMHRLKTLRLKIFAIPAIYVKASGIEILRLGVIDKRLRGKICYLMQKIQGLNLILGNCNAFG